MKENKQENIKVRITPKEKERIVEYCESHNITISEFIRMAVSRIFVESKGRPIYIERESNIVNDTISKEANKISTDALDVLRRKGE